MNDDDRVLGPPHPLGYVQVRVLELHPEGEVQDADLPWAQPAFVLVSVKGGVPLIPPKDSIVWVGFEKGNPRCPVWFGLPPPVGFSPVLVNRENKYPKVYAFANPEGNIRILILDKDSLKVEVADPDTGELVYSWSLDRVQKQCQFTFTEGRCILTFGTEDDNKTVLNIQEGETILATKDFTVNAEGRIVFHGAQVVVSGDSVRLSGESVTAAAKRTSGFERHS